MLSLSVFLKKSLTCCLLRFFSTHISKVICGISNVFVCVVWYPSDRQVYRTENKFNKGLIFFFYIYFIFQIYILLLSDELLMIWIVYLNVIYASCRWLLLLFLSNCLFLMTFLYLKTHFKKKMHLFFSLNIVSEHYLIVFFIMFSIISGNLIF